MPKKPTPARKLDRAAPHFDNDQMPWGKFRGLRMDRVPLWYWKWMLDQDFAAYWPGVMNYAMRRLGLPMVPADEDAPF